MFSYRDAPDSCKIKICESLGEGIVLDIGCLSRIYEPHCSGTYVGIDLLVSNKDKKPDVLCDAQYLPFRNGAVNSILAFDVIEHLPLSHLFLTECFRVLASMGRVFITTPNGPRSPFANGDPTHVSIFTRSRLRDALRSTGFDARFDDVFYIHSPRLSILRRLPHFLGNWLASKLVSNTFVVATKRQHSSADSNSLRILALTNDPPSYVIGFSLVFIEICRLLSKAGHTVRLISRKGGAVERVLGRSPIELRLSTPESSQLAAALVFLLKSTTIGLRIGPSYDIVFSCDIACVPALIVGKLRGLKTAVLFFDVYPLDEWMRFQKSLLRKMFVALIVLTTYLSLRFFDAVLSISPYTEELIRRKGLSRSLIRTVGLPIEGAQA